MRGRRDAISGIGVAGASFGSSLCRFIFDLAAISQGRIAPPAFPVFQKHSSLSRTRLLNERTRVYCTRTLRFLRIIPSNNRKRRKYRSTCIYLFLSIQ